LARQQGGNRGGGETLPGVAPRGRRLDTGRVSLTILVEATLSGAIDGLSWVAVFAGTFPDRRFLRLDTGKSQDDMRWVRG